MIQDTTVADGTASAEKCRRSIFLTDPEIDRQRLLDRKGERVAGTCEWILQDPTHKSWLQDDPDLLWICGGPGKGKTMMSIFLTQTFERQNRDDTIYYFCNSEDDRNSTSSAILRALIWQIMAKRPELASLVMPHFQSPERTQAVLSTPGTLFEIFTKLAQDPKMTPMHCFIDGLDECEHDSIRWIASRLVDLYRGTQKIKVRICIVSRDVLELRQTNRILLDPDNNDKIDTDIKTFTSLKMLDLIRRHNLSDDLILQIQTRLLPKAEGTFLWIGYAMRELLTKATVMQVLEALEELPTALPALYSRMIRNIAADKLQTCISILHWVALAMESLTLDALADAVGWRVPDHMTPEQAAQDYISLCKPLISIQRNTGTVVFVHQSVKDYLMRTQPDDDPVVESARVKNAESHLAMADRCLKALGSRRSAFARYANRFWPQHAKQCGRLAISWIVQNKYFFGERSEIRAHWWQFYREMSRAQSTDHTFLKKQLDPPNLHMACSIGFTHWVDHILSSKRRLLEPWKRSINHCGNGLATPLHFAVFSGNSETAEYLLEKGADPNMNLNTVLSLFDYALRFNGSSRDYVILESMLAHGADANLVLRKAVSSYDFFLLGLAIKYNANVNLPMKDVFRLTSSPSLHQAVRGLTSDRSSAIIRRLLEAGADPLIEDSTGRTAAWYLYDPSTANNFSLDARIRNEQTSLAIRRIFEEFGYSCA